MVIIIIVMVYYVGKAQTNFINWGFFILNVLVFSMIARSDHTIKKMRPVVCMAKVLIIYSSIIMFADILFISIVGQNPKLDASQADSPDRMF